MRMPASPAITLDSTQLHDDARSGSMPRSAASPRRSTAARVSSPHRVRRNRNHRRAATTSAAPKTASWLLSRLTPSDSVTRRGGVGPRPGTEVAVSPPAVGSERPATSPITLAPHSTSAGSATSTPTDATIRASSAASARRRNSRRSSATPTSGANNPTATSAAGTIGQPSPPAVSGWLSWKNTNAVAKATAPWPRLNTPEVWYVSSSPDASTAYSPPVTAPLRTKLRSSATATPTVLERNSGP